LTAEGEPMY